MTVISDVIQNLENTQSQGPSNNSLGSAKKGKKKVEIIFKKIKSCQKF
jgi:hypothetical protein